MDKSLIGHSLLAVGAAGLALAAWLSPKPDQDDMVTVIAGTADTLSSIAWHEDGWDVRVSRKDGQVSVTATKLAKEPTEAPSPAKTFPGTKEAEDLFAKLMPLVAGRALGRLDAAHLKTMGLDAPTSRLSLHMGPDEKDAKVIEIGNAAYGTGDLYGKNSDGEVFLLKAATFAGLRNGASPLLDRTLVGVKEEKVKRVAITGKAAGREVVQRDGEDRAKAFYADPAEPETKLETTGNWLNRLYRLRVVDLVNDPPEGDPAIEVELFDDKASLGHVKLWPAGDKTALAASSRFASPVTVSKAEVDALVKDLESVIGEGK